jgi:hypothetical protein
MSDQVFPSFLKGFDIKVRRAPVFSTEIQAAESGKEQAATFWSTPIYEYEVTFNFLRQLGFSQFTLQDEARVLIGFFEAHRGRFDSFWFDDPYDGIRRRVRFDSDRLDTERFLYLVWSGESIPLRSVK